VSDGSTAMRFGRCRGGAAQENFGLLLFFSPLKGGGGSLSHEHALPLVKLQAKLKAATVLGLTQHPHEGLAAAPG
jgi:hypothetical protein